MPTYVCSVPPKKLSSSQKSEIAKSISNRHSEATGAPPFFVQVVIKRLSTIVTWAARRLQITSGSAVIFVLAERRRREKR